MRAIVENENDHPPIGARCRDIPVYPNTREGTATLTGLGVAGTVELEIEINNGKAYTFIYNNDMGITEQRTGVPVSMDRERIQINENYVDDAPGTIYAANNWTRRLHIIHIDEAFLENSESKHDDPHEPYVRV